MISPHFLNYFRKDADNDDMCIFELKWDTNMFLQRSCLLVLFILLFGMMLQCQAEESRNFRFAGHDDAGSMALSAARDNFRPGQTSSITESGILEFEILDCHGPRPARIMIMDSHGHRVGGLPGLGWIWVDGIFRGCLPVGRVNIHLVNGPRMVPWQGTFNVKADKIITQNTVLGNFAAVAKQGWWICDPYIQADAGQDDPEKFSFSRFGEVTLAARAEGIEIAGVGGCWNLANSKGTYGHLREGIKFLTIDLLRSRKKRFSALYAWKLEQKNEGGIYVIEPLPTREHVRPGQLLFENITDLHDRGALVIASHPMGLDASGEMQAEGAAVQMFYDMLAGCGVDAVDISQHEDDFYFWQVLLNEGYRVAAVGGGPGVWPADSLDLPAIGCYIHLKPGRNSRKDIIDAVKQGRVIVSNGPFINLAIDGRGIGSVVQTSTNMRNITVEARASSFADDNIRRIELIYNGKVIRRIRGNSVQKIMQIQTKNIFTEPGWIIARYYSSVDRLWAITNPVYVKSPGLVSPRAVSAHVSLSLYDHDTGKRIPGMVEIYNMGTCLQKSCINNDPLSLNIPATARLKVYSKGYCTRELSIYKDGGPADFMSTLARGNKIRTAMLSWKTFDKLRMILRKINLNVRLKPNHP